MKLIGSVTNDARSTVRRNALSFRPGAAFSLLFAALLWLPGSAAHSGKLPLERLFTAPDLSGPSLRGVKISPDGRLVAYLKARDDDKDRFVAFIQCSARDWMEDADTGRVVNGNRAAPTTFQQFWTFTRDPHNGWVLDEIQQAEEGAYHLGKADIDSDDGSPRPAARA